MSSPLPHLRQRVTAAPPDWRALLRSVSRWREDTELSLTCADRCFNHLFLSSLRHAPGSCLCVNSFILVTGHMAPRARPSGTAARALKGGIRACLPRVWHGRRRSAEKRLTEKTSFGSFFCVCSRFGDKLLTGWTGCCFQRVKTTTLTRWRTVNQTNQPGKYLSLDFTHICGFYLFDAARMITQHL